VLLGHPVDGNKEGTGGLHVLTHGKKTCCSRFRNHLHLRLPASGVLCNSYNYCHQPVSRCTGGSGAG
nr:hypothetical protein [Tanacetum cinerariifolium]